MGKIFILLLCLIVVVYSEISHGSETVQDIPEIALETREVLAEKFENEEHHKIENFTQGMEVKNLHKVLKKRRPMDGNKPDKEGKISHKKKFDEEDRLLAEIPSLEIPVFVTQAPEIITGTQENETPEKVPENEENAPEYPEIEKRIFATPEIGRFAAKRTSLPPPGGQNVPEKNPETEGNEKEALELTGINADKIIQHELDEIEDDKNTAIDFLDMSAFNNSNAVGDRVGYESTGAGFAGIFLVYHYPSKTQKGIAFGVNMYWVICSTQILPDDVVAKDVRLYHKVKDGEKPTRLGAQKHKVREIRVHVEEGQTHPVQNTMMLMRVCPRIKTFFKLPLASKLHPVGEIHFVINYMLDLRANFKEVAENCECDEMPGWDKYRQYCLVESQTIYNGPTEKGTISFTAAGLMGINTYGTDDGGEPYLNVVYYLPWIAANTPIPPEDE